MAPNDQLLLTAHFVGWLQLARQWILLLSRFLPLQISFGVPHTKEAAVRVYLASLQSGQGLLKFNSKNVFNVVRRDTMIHIVLEDCRSCTRSFYFYASLLSFG